MFGLCAALILGAAQAGCRATGADGTVGQTEAVGAAPASRSEPTPTTRVRRGQVDVVVTASGSVVAPRLTELGPEVSGRLAAVHFDVGDRVAKGDVVLQLDPTPFRTNLKRARAGLALARAEAAQAQQELARIRRLAEQNVVSPRQLDRQRTHLAVARARVDQEAAAVEGAEQELARTAVTSPYDGHVVERQLHEGAIVGPRSIVVTVQERTGLAAELDVPAAAAPVRIGDPVLLTVEGADAPFEARIASVNAKIDPETRTYRVRAPVPGSLPGTRAGAFVRADIRPRTPGGAVIVDRAAVLDRDGRAYLFQVEADRARRIEIRIGASGARWIEIRGGAEPGDTVIVGPAIERLADGATISVAEAPPGNAGKDPSRALRPKAH